MYSFLSVLGRATTANPPGKVEDLFFRDSSITLFVKYRHKSHLYRYGEWLNDEQGAPCTRQPNHFC